MIELRGQMRMLIAEFLLAIATKVTPNNSEGETFRRCAANYFNKKINGE